MAVEAQTSPSPPFSTEGLGPCEVSCSHSIEDQYQQWVLWSTCGNDEVHCVGSHLAAAVDGDGDVIKNKIKCFLQLPEPIWRRSLVQFWGLGKTRGKMYLTTRHQPFALQYYCSYDLPDVNKLCEYRKQCLKYLIRTVDDDDEISVDGVEQVIGGPLSRVFRSGFPEYAPDVRHYTSREYPLRDSAVGRVEGYVALPVYHHPAHHLPSGVLEIASLGPCIFSIYLKEIVAKLQEVNLTIPCLSLVEVSSCQDGEIAKIEEALSEVDEILEMDGTQIWTTTGEILSSQNGEHFIRKGQGVVGKAFSSKNACFCRDARQLSIAEYPMVPTARHHAYSASFAVCLQSSCSNSCIYVLEFFLSTNEKDLRDPRRLLHKLMETLKKHLRSSFKIASGQELGQKMSVEVLKVSPEDEFDSFEICNTTRRSRYDTKYRTPRKSAIQLVEVQGGAGMTPSIEHSANEVTNIKNQKSSYTLKSDLEITREVLEQNSSRNLEDAAEVLGVSRSTLKRICRDYGIRRWPPRKARRVNQAYAEQRVVQPSIETIEAHHRPDTTRLEDDSCIWVKAEYQGRTMKFRLPLSARKSNLEEEVAQRLNPSIGSFKIEYQDEENDWIWIACDKDLNTCMNTLSSLGRTTIKMKVK